MRRRLAPLLVALLGASFGVACYEGLDTVGAICEANADCGADQSCTNQVCGQCGNGRSDPGEFCYGAADEQRIGGVVRLLVDADLDEDGDIDLVAISNTNCGGLINGPCWQTRILVNDGMGDLDALIGEEINGTIESIEIGNFDGNDEIDAAFTLENAPTLLVVTDLFSARAVTNLAMPGDARSVRQADVDGDGDFDLLAAADPLVSNGDTVFWFENDGNANFGAAQGIQANPGAWLAPLFDMQGDGHVDLIVANRPLDQITVLHGDGTGNFTIAQELDTQVTPSFIAAADLDVDGRADLAVANFGSASVSLFRGTADGSLAEAEHLPVGPSPTFVRITDVNVDAQPDLVVANTDDDKLSIYLGREGEFPDAIEFDVGAAPNWIVHNDFNGDGQPDLAVASGADLSFSYGDF